MPFAPDHPSDRDASLGISVAEVARQLDRILADPLFQSSQRLSGFLRFVVESALHGKVDQLKEHVIGVDVFGLSESYNPQENPVVRIMAGRLRSKLAEYYLSRGLSDPVFIEIPKGGYAPRFLHRLHAQPADTLTVLPQVRAEAVCVGRKRELGRLLSSLREVHSAGLIWSVSGEAGMGKTALGEDFLSEIRVGPQVWIGRGAGSERLAGTDAYVPILEALHGLLADGPGSHVAEVMNTTAPTWRRQLGAVKGETGAAGNESAPASHERMRREIVEFFEALSASAPVVLFLDDLHWADASTCDLLTYLSARLQRLPLLLLMTHRPTAVSSRDCPFRRLLLEFERRGICRRLELPFLSPADIANYIGLQFPVNRFPEEFARVVHERTEGNPLFMTAMLRFFQDRAVIAEVDGAWVLGQSLEAARKLVPTGISSLIRLKLDRLNSDDVQLLTCASVQGMQFDSAVIAAALGRTSVQVEERLQELEAAHDFVRSLGEQTSPGRAVSVRYRFVHVCYQNELYASLTPSRRAERSCAVANALVAMAGGTSRAFAADVALLFEAGHDHANAATYFHYAARNAARLFAHPEAIQLAERGLRALAAVPASRQRDARELALLQILSLGLMATRGYASPEVQQVLRRSLDLGLALNDTRRLPPVLWGLHTCEVNAGNLEPSLRLARQMQDIADATGEVEAAVQAAHALGTTLAFMGRLQEARDALERIFHLKPAEQQSVPGSVYLLDPVVTSLSMLARLLAYMGYLDQAAAKAASSMEVAKQLAHPQSIAYATFWVGWVHHARGEYEDSLRHLESAMNLSCDRGLTLIEEWGRVVRGSALAHLGRPAQGIEEIRKSLNNQEAMGSFLERAYCLTLLAEALANQGSYQDALGLCDQAVEFGTRTGGRCYEAETYRVRAELMLRAGSSPAAAVDAEFCRSLELARNSQCRLLELRAAISYCRFQDQIGDGARGTRVLSQVADWFVEGDHCPTLLEARRLLARCSLPVRE